MNYTANDYNYAADPADILFHITTSRAEESPNILDTPNKPQSGKALFDFLGIGVM